MEILKVTKLMICSIATVLLFSIGYVQDSEAGVSQASMTIRDTCTITVNSADLTFGVVSPGSTPSGFFTAANNGNDNLSWELVTPIPGGGSAGQEGDWYAAGPTSIIDGSSTAATGTAVATPGTTLGATAVALNNLAPINQGGTPLTLTLTTTVTLLQPYGGPLNLDLDLVNLGC